MLAEIWRREMAVVKGKSRSARAGSIVGGRPVMRLASTGRYVEAGAGAAEITLAPGVFGEIIGRKGTAKGLLTGFGKAVHRAEQSGRAVRLTVLVEPGKPVSKVAVEDAVEQRPRDELDEALTEARQRGAKRAAEILQAPDMLSADQFAAAIGATRETVHQKRRRGEVLGLEGAKRGVRFPDWQIGADGRLLAGLPHLIESLGKHPWAVHRFLLQHHPELDGSSALEALRRGRVDEVLAAARSVEEGTFA